MFRGLYGQRIDTIQPGRHSPIGQHSPFKKQPHIIEIKKDVGVKSLRAYPNYQALALPLGKDKQRKPAHAR